MGCLSELSQSIRDGFALTVSLRRNRTSRRIYAVVLAQESWARLFHLHIDILVSVELTFASGRDVRAMCGKVQKPAS